MNHDSQHEHQSPGLRAKVDPHGCRPDEEHKPEKPHKPDDRPRDNPDPDRREENGGDLPQPPTVPYSPFLLIPYAAGDTGVRPLGTGINFWESPAIYVESPDPLKLGRPIASVPNFVHAVISNRGAQEISPIVVDFWWGNPALGLAEGQMRYIGTEEVRRILPGKVKDVRCNTAWTPVVENEGHECLMVNCTGRIFDVLPAANRFQPQIDRRVGQRNVTVITTGAGSFNKLSIDLVNSLPFRAQTVILAAVDQVVVPRNLLETERPRNLLAQVVAAVRTRAAAAGDFASRFSVGTRLTNDPRRMQMSEQPHAAQEFKPEIVARPVAAVIRSRLSETIGTVRSGAEGRSFANLLLAMEGLAFGSAGAVPAGSSALHELTCQPGEQRKLTVELETPGNARAGDFFVYRLSQLADGFLLGGYTVIVQAMK